MSIPGYMLNKGKTMAGKLVLCRHGQSEWNKQNLFTGWYDIGLTEQGATEAIVEMDNLHEGAIAKEFLATRHGQRLRR